eukprot:985700-Alexandrium_andersonii.AAC.1
MSASLVGSEMCIRDSDSSRAGAKRALIARLLVSGHVVAIQETHWDPPVSYTHLTLPTICSV